MLFKSLLVTKPMGSKIDVVVFSRSISVFNVFCYSLPRYYLIDPNLNRNYLHVLQKEKED